MEPLWLISWTHGRAFYVEDITVNIALLILEVIPRTYQQSAPTFPPYSFLTIHQELTELIRVIYKVDKGQHRRGGRGR